ncbi:MAG: TIM barrel protein [Verrucomicrobiota bacterium]
MRLGLGSYTYTWACGVPGHLPARPLTALALCRRAMALGIGVVQLCENISLVPHEWPGVAATGLRIEIGTRGLLSGALEAAWAAAVFFRSPFVRLVIDSGSHEPPPEETVRLLQPWAARARETGIRLAIENHDRFPATVLADIVEKLGTDAVGVTLDTVNSFGAAEGPEHVIQTLAPYVLSLHIKDFTIRRVPSQMGFTVEGCPAGEGMLNPARLLETLRAAGRDPNAIIELWTPPAETLEATILREAAWAEKSIANLRPLVAG